MYTNAGKKRVQVDSAPQSTQIPSVGIIPGGIPHSAMLSMLDNSALAGGGASDLGQQMRERLALDRQIPSAEREADRLAASVSGAHTPEEVKAQLGEKMGADFSAVRFHTDASAVGMAEHIGARAYTAGQDVYFGQGGFDPAVAAHELVHTAQQGVVESAVPTVSAPMGEVQMMPKVLQKIGGFFKNLFKSKEQRNLDKISGTTVPSRAAEQQPQHAFTQKQIDNMQTSSCGSCGDSTIEEKIQPVTNPMGAEMGDYFDALGQSGFDFDRAGQGIQEFVPSRSGAAKVRYNSSTIAATKKLLSMFSGHLDAPEMQAMLSEVYKHEMQNPGKTPGVEGYSAMESRFLKNIMSKGLMPMGSQIKRANRAGQQEKLPFLMGVQTTSGYLETMWGRDNLPEELKDLMAAYAPIREKMLNAARNGVASDPQTQDTLRRQYAATSAPTDFDPTTATSDEALAQNLRLYNRAVEQGDDFRASVFRQMLPRHLR